MSEIELKYIGQENEKAKLDAETAKTQVAESVTDELIRYTEAQAREKHGWVTVNGANTVVTDQGK